MQPHHLVGATALAVLFALGSQQLAEGLPFAQARPSESSANNLRSFYRVIEAEEGVTCGYASCPPIDANKLNVHVVAHTHDDVGWLKTVDQYFYGTKKRFNPVGVEHILDSLIPALMLDRTKRFVYVEMSFFTKWWNEQDENMKSIVKQLVNEGRLEFINGGWCMNDEATVNYNSVIEQMTLGLRFINETFGACGQPKVGWQIDPFGHSNEQASLFAQFGFDGMFFSRIGYGDKLRRTRDKSLDLIWHGDRALSGQTGSIFTNIFRDHYELDLFCFDVQCQDDLVVDNKNSYEYNVDKMAHRLVEYARGYAQSKLTNNILLPFGGDFHFSAAGQNFKSFDRLIKFIRANASDINIFYSTPSCYQLAVHQSLRDARNVSLPEKYDDFMPYDSSATVWWSGYFTSRPSTKLIERETARMLQVTRMISLLELIQRAHSRQASSSDWIKDVHDHEKRCLMPLWETLSDLQHHDAVTGTEKQHVADDYQRRVSDASHKCAKMITDVRRHHLEAQLRKSPHFEHLKLAAAKVHLDPIYLEETMFCHSLNISQCEALESDVDVHRYTHLKVVKAHYASHTHHHSNLSHSVPQKPIPLPKELETKSILLTVFNPLTRPMRQVDIRLPCNGNCDLDKVRVIHLASNETLKLFRLPLPSGVARLPFRESLTKYEFLFYADVPELGSATYVIGDENTDLLVDEELADDSVVITDETLRQNKQNVVRGRRIQRQVQDSTSGADDSKQDDRYEYFTMRSSSEDIPSSGPRRGRTTRDTGSLAVHESSSDRVVLKFDMRTGMITGLRRASDGSALNITQKFGQYWPADMGHQPGAYIFRPNSSEPHLFEKPISFKMYKRQNGGLIEIHQKWAEWIWQTIRVDSRKNYIEFDYVVGPIPVHPDFRGREVVTRYITNMANDGVFFTDSNARQLLPRRRLNDDTPTQTGGSFYPVVSTLMVRNNKVARSNVSAEAVAILVDRAQAGTSLNNGDLELLIHRRLMHDDSFGVDEALNEPGEDGRGLVTRGRHRLFLKFHEQSAGDHGAANHQAAQLKTSSHRTLIELPPTPRQNLTYERSSLRRGINSTLDSSQDPGIKPTYLVNDQLFNDIRQESVKYALRPFLTFDRLRVSPHELVQLLNNNNHLPRTDQTLLNMTLPSNVHLLTLQAWNKEDNQLLLRFENLDNPLTLHPMPDETTYEILLKSYQSDSSRGNQAQQDDPCNTRGMKPVEFDIEYLLRKIRIISINELNLGANSLLSDDKRLDWTDENPELCGTESGSPTSVKLSPRQIRTFLATFELI